MKRTLFLAGLLGLTACSYFPYQPQITQGNLLTQEKIDALKVGMSQDQVRLILGSPVLTDTFDQSTWNYVYTVQKVSHFKKYRRVIIHFKNGRVYRIDADLPDGAMRHQHDAVK